MFWNANLTCLKVFEEVEQDYKIEQEQLINLEGPSEGIPLAADASEDIKVVCPSQCQTKINIILVKRSIMVRQEQRYHI